MNSIIFAQAGNGNEGLYTSAIPGFTQSFNTGNTSGTPVNKIFTGAKSEIIVKRFEPLPFSISAALLLSAGTYMHLKASENWWLKPGRFHIRNSRGPESIFTGAGHFYSANLNGHLFSGVYESSGMQALESTWYSSLSSLVYSGYIEAENGFHQGRGFSISNMAGNVIGTAFYIGQYYYPVLKNIQPRISYLPTEGSGREGMLVPDDIYGQKLWLNFRMPELLPQIMGGIWPDFLNAAAGIGIMNRGDKKIISTFIALDLDAEKLPLHGPFWQFVKNTLNYFHFPMPGIRISPETTAFIFCF